MINSLCRVVEREAIKLRLKKVITFSLVFSMAVSSICINPVYVRAEEAREVIQGTTEYQKEQAKEIQEQIKQVKKDKEKIETEKESLESEISAIQSFSAYCNQNEVKDPVGTKIAVAEKVNELIPSDLDERLSILADEIDSQTLRDWGKTYTLEKVKDTKEDVLTIKEEIPSDDLSPLLIQLCREIKTRNSDIIKKNQAINKQQKQLTELSETEKSMMTEKVFNPNDVTVPSNLTAEELHTGLDDTKIGYLSDTFVECEKEYGVNAVFLASIAAHESGWGTSRRAINDHNYTGFGVYSNSAEGINANSGEDNIRMTAKHLAENYLNPGGKYYNGVSVRAVHTLYCATGGWTDGVCKNANTIMTKIIENPVYIDPDNIYNPSASTSEESNQVTVTEDMNSSNGIPSENMITVCDAYEIIDGRAYFNQGDAEWNQAGYSMSSAGCGPTAMAIIVTSLGKQALTPLQAAEWGRSHGYYSSGGSQHEMIPAMAKEFDVDCEGAGKDIDKVRKGLQEGAMVVCLMGSGTFTRGGHFIVLSSINENDMVTVLDVASRSRTGNNYPLSQIISEGKSASAGGPFWIMKEK